MLKKMKHCADLSFENVFFRVKLTLLNILNPFKRAGGNLQFFLRVTSLEIKF